MPTHHMAVSFTAAILIAVSGALPAQAGDATLLGTGIGAATGGLIGSQFGHGGGQIATTTLGIAAGGVIGNSIGQSIENARNAPPVYGTNYVSSAPDAPITYRGYAPNYVAPPAPPPIYVDEDIGTYCPAFSQRIRINGGWQESYGTACLQPDGVWRIVQ